MSCDRIALHSIALHSIALHSIALHCIALHSIALHCIALHSIALHCIAFHCIALHCIPLHCIALHCIPLHCIALHCIALHSIALHCIALHSIALHCIAFHCIALHCIALHCIAFHCIALHSIAFLCCIACSLTLSFSPAIHCTALHFLHALPSTPQLLDMCQAATRCTTQQLPGNHTPSTLPLPASCHPTSPALPPFSSSVSSSPSKSTDSAQSPLCSLIISPLSPGPFTQEAAAISASTGLPLHCTQKASPTSNNSHNSDSSSSAGSSSSINSGGSTGTSTDSVSSSASGSVWQWLDFGGVFRVKSGCYGDRRGVGRGRGKGRGKEQEKDHHPASIALSLPLSGSITNAMCSGSSAESGCRCQETADMHGATTISASTGKVGTGDEWEGGVHLEPEQQGGQQEQEQEQEKLRCLAVCAVCSDAGWMDQGRKKERRAGQGDVEGRREVMEEEGDRPGSSISSSGSSGVREGVDVQSDQSQLDSPAPFPLAVHVVLISARPIVRRFHVAINHSRVAAFSLWRPASPQNHALLPLVPTRHLSLSTNSTPLHHLTWKAGLPLQQQQQQQQQQPGKSFDADHTVPASSSTTSGVEGANRLKIRPTALLVLHMRERTVGKSGGHDIEDSRRPLLTLRGDVSLDDGDAYEMESSGGGVELSLKKVVDSMPPYVSMFAKSSFPFPFAFVHRLLID
ncbi:unnamed protein product [Closterium sp. NIES-54]